MLKLRHSQPIQFQSGLTLLEVLVAMVILAFGLLGLASLQAKMQVVQFESYQRAQAIILLSEIIEKINSNRSQAANYASSNVIGTGDTQPATCTGSPGATLDLCQWSNDLKGANELLSSTNIGAMVGARGCITQIQAPNLSAGVCTPAIYQVDVAWQGTIATSAPLQACAQGLYGSNDAFRRVVSTQITIGLPTCS